MARKNSLKSIGAASFIALSAVTGAPATLGFEGMKLKPYYDSVGVKTWCAGETEVGYKESFTEKECNFLYDIRYGYYSYRTMLMYKDKGAEVATPEIHAALTDMSYNVGIGAVEKSSMIRELNAGQPVKACNAILMYKKAGGHDCSKPGNKVCPGVWTRRLKMNELCLKGAK